MGNRLASVPVPDDYLAGSLNWKTGAVGLQFYSPTKGFTSPLFKAASCDNKDILMEIGVVILMFKYPSSVEK